MVLDFFFDMKCLKKKIATMLLSCLCLQSSTRTIACRQLIVYSSDRENFNIIDLFPAHLFSNFSHKEGHLSYPRKKPAEFFCLSHHPVLSLSTPLLIGFIYFPFWLRFYLKIKGFLS